MSTNGEKYGQNSAELGECVRESRVRGKMRRPKQALEEGKPEKIVEKMVDGRINKYYKEVCLIEQPFIKDPDQTVQNILGDVKVRRFTSYQLGEGLEKRNEDFAAEVAAQIK